MTDILAFGAHPDDIEMGVGGILLKARAEGQTVTLVDLTSGSSGSHGTVAQRKQEGLAAAKYLNAERVCLDLPDGQVRDTQEAREEVVKVIRHYKPKLVLTQWYYNESTHPDHVAGGRLVHNGWRAAMLGGLLPEVPAHRSGGILYYSPPYIGRPDFLFDISDHVDTWRAMIEAHATQHKTRPYTDRCLKGAAALGVLCNAEYAQGLYKANPVVIDSLNTVARTCEEI